MEPDRQRVACTLHMALLLRPRWGVLAEDKLWRGEGALSGAGLAKFHLR